jgi:hypothetical protein
MVNAYAAQCLAPFPAVHDKLGLITEGILSLLVDAMQI